LQRFAESFNYLPRLFYHPTVSSVYNKNTLEDVPVAFVGKLDFSPRMDKTKISGVQKMDIKRNGTQPSSQGPEDWFTGTVRVDPLFQAPDPARASGASVTFEPGARTAWHSHPLGQTLIVTAGCGRVRCWGGPIEEIHPGDVIWIPPGEKHWHGSAPTTAMTHIAIAEKLDGKSADWMEKVSDKQYQG
jgi:quercetin dioxygenase-like cupin family protein